MQTKMGYLVLVIIFIQSCRSDRSKSQLLWTTNICNKMYVETYMIIGGGSGGGDRVSQYLTDSTNFRIYIGTYVQLDKHYWYQCISDSIRVNEVDELNGDKIISTRTFFLPDLQKENRFE